MSDKKKLKKLSPLLTDEEAEKFTEEADLSEYDLSGFKPVKFEFQKKDARLEMRLSHDQLKALKAEAKAQGMQHTRLARLFIEQGMQALHQK